MRTAFMPAGFFSRVIARLHHLEFNMTPWRDCVLVSRNQHRALIQVHRRTEEDVIDLVIVVRGASPGNLLDVLAGVVDDLTANWYTGITWQTYLRCTKCAMDVADPCLFEIHSVVLAAVLPNKELSCDHSQRTLVRDEWLSFIQPVLQRSLSRIEEPSELQRQALNIFKASRCPADAPIAQPDSSSSSAIQVPAIATTIPRVGMQEVSQATGNFAPSRRIGGGGFGSVYSGIWGGAQVAVKRLAADSMQGIAQFQAELESLSRFRHPNIVTIMCYAHEGGECCLVYELMANGSVRDRLDCNNGTPALSWPQRQRIATEIASALHFVQTAIPRQPLFHLDLKTDNVLLDAHFTAKVADFGLTRSAPAQTATQSYIQTQTIQGTPQYICPQYRDEGKVSIKTDVYSYGMILLELLTGQQPGSVLTSAVKTALSTHGQFDSELDASITWSAADKLAATEVAKLALACLKPDRHDRPTFGQIPAQLKGDPDQVEATEESPHGDRECMLCYNAPTTAKLMPCCHACVCVACAQEMIRRQDKCMVCRVVPTSYLKGSFDQTFVQVSDRECMLCYNAPTTAKLMPCCHACVCVACAQEMIRRQDKCMICRVIPTAYLPGTFNQTFVL
ncbi:hypothetical protein CAOG_08263 [Capsaspora owczarzaki ATCC 30864]|nr:hypothetical protein CAOG_08263 [Capsaspora owczarzaki ATCC 30864]|eukprot:XP_004342432.1 hypothetical protein CAOG_08263 [Capsaspora owczarzaki ATCC 30864]